MIVQADREDQVRAWDRGQQLGLGQGHEDTGMTQILLFVTRHGVQLVERVPGCLHRRVIAKDAAHLPGGRLRKTRGGQVEELVCAAENRRMPDVTLVQCCQFHGASRFRS